MAEAPPLVLVRHRAGHCVARDGWFADDCDLVATLCGHHVLMPFGISRAPGDLDCADCAAAQSAEGVAAGLRVP